MVDLANFEQFEPFIELTTAQSLGRDERAVEAIDGILKDCGYSQYCLALAREIIEFFIEHGMYAENFKTLYFNLASGNADIAEGLVTALMHGAMDFNEYDRLDKLGIPLSRDQIVDLVRRLDSLNPVFADYSELRSYRPRVS